jgi:hypothetical protein
LTWKYEEVQLALHLLNDIDRLLIADAPGWSSCHGSQLNVPPVQLVLAERSDSETAVSHFAAVMVPSRAGTIGMSHDLSYF